MPAAAQAMAVAAPMPELAPVITMFSLVSACDIGGIVAATGGNVISRAAPAALVMKSVDYRDYKR